VVAALLPRGAPARQRGTVACRETEESERGGHRAEGQLAGDGRKRRFFLPSIWLGPTIPVHV
jgi:hypothetical protein